MDGSGCILFLILLVRFCGSFVFALAIFIAAACVNLSRMN